MGSMISRTGRHLQRYNIGERLVVGLARGQRHTFFSERDAKDIIAAATLLTGTVQAMGYTARTIWAIAIWIHVLATTRSHQIWDQVKLLSALFIVVLQVSVLTPNWISWIIWASYLALIPWAWFKQMPYLLYRRTMNAIFQGLKIFIRFMGRSLMQQNRLPI